MAFEPSSRLGVLFVFFCVCGLTVVDLNFMVLVAPRVSFTTERAKKSSEFNFFKN